MPMSSESLIESIQRSRLLHADNIERRRHLTTEEREYEESFIASFNRGLEIISVQLYKDRTHFILELIQNADDNKYFPESTPTLKFRLSRTRLLVKCNEIGFTEANLKAICDVNASTKIGPKEGESQFIGEKGIGFKAVFSVADKVSIFSNGYNFQLDKNRPLGMINPISIKGPRHLAKDGWTIFLMDLILNADQYDEVYRTFQRLQSEVLLFTRRLRHIEIFLDSDPTMGNAKSIIHKSISTPNSSIFEISSSKFESQQYFVQHMLVRDMPPNSRREGVTSSRITLAFPFDCISGPTIQPQNIFAFLPLYRTPMPFLIQADFITQLSREGVLEQEPWNIRLRDSVADCLVQSISEMKEHALFLTDGLMYVPHDIRDTASFLDPIIVQIRHKLSTEPVIRTRTGRWISPINAVLLEPAYIIEGRPIVTSAELQIWRPRSCDFADDAYNKARLKSIIKWLGGIVFDVNIFLSILSSALFDFTSKPLEWFGRLFAILYEKGGANKKAMDPCYLRLSDGSWTSPAAKSSIYFPSIEYDVNDLDLVVLHDDFNRVIQSESKAKRFMRDILGIRELDNVEIINAIADRHENHLRRPLSKEICLRHAKFLAKYRHLLDHTCIDRLKRSFRVIDQCDRIQLSNDVILDRQVRGCWLSHICASTSAVSFLSQSYNKSCRNFFEQIFDMLDYPPLVQEQLVRSRRRNWRNNKVVSDIYTHVLSPTELQNNFVLHLLADIWDHVPSFDVQIFKYDSQVRGLVCLCENGSYTPLSSCYIRTSNLDYFLTSQDDVIEVDRPNEQKWDFLKDLGVTTELKLDLLLNQIRVAKSQKPNLSTHHIDTLYTRVVMFYDSHPDVLPLVRNAFSCEELLNVRHGTSSIWLSSASLFKYCPEWVQASIARPISEPIGFARLCDNLQLPEWSPEHNLLTELEFGVGHLQGKKAEWEEIAHYVFKGLKSVIGFVPKSGDCPQWIRSVLQLPIFPILTSDKQHDFVCLGSHIFVPDSGLLNTLLLGKVNCLDFGEPHRVYEIRQILELSDSGLRFLSSYDKVDNMKIKVVPPVSHDELQQHLRTRGTWFLRFLYFQRASGMTTASWKSILEMWDKILVKSCYSLEQNIQIPEFNINQMQCRESYYELDSDSGSVTIFLIAEQDVELKLLHLSQHLSHVFEVPKYQDRIALILMSRLEQLDLMFKCIWKIPDLPTETISNTYNDFGFHSKHGVSPDNHLTPAMRGLSLDSELPIDEADSIIKTIELMIGHSHVVDKSILPARRVPSKYIFDSFSDIAHTSSEAVISEHRLSIVAGGPRGYNNDLSEPVSIIRSGFAGEYYMFRWMEQRLPGFGVHNWTSCLRRFAKFPPCEEGPSDFFYDEDMQTFQQVFRVRSGKKWKKAYLEVKATIATANEFKLTDRQFMMAQKLHNTDELYIIVHIQNSLSNPQILDIIDEPIIHLNEGRISVRTDGGVFVQVL